MLQPFVRGILRKAARHSCSKPFAMQNAAPLVSFTFDDVPASAATVGATVLERHGARGTFYVAAGILGKMDRHWRVIDAAQVRALADRGHEIGCHTFSHVGVDTLDATALNDECRRNNEALRAICPKIEIANFCFPYGRASLPRKLELGRRFDTCRGVYQGINAGTVDLSLLRVIELYDRTLSPAKLRRVLRETRERNGWLIFYTHDVADPPSWIGASPQLLDETIAAVRAENMRCLTIRDACTAIGWANAGSRDEILAGGARRAVVAGS